MELITLTKSQGTERGKGKWQILNKGKTIGWSCMCMLPKNLIALPIMPHQLGMMSETIAVAADVQLV